MAVKRISSGSFFEQQVGYSRAVIDGDYIFVAGTTGYDYQTMHISDDVVEQAEQCFKNIKAVLEEAGSSLNDVVRINYIFPKRDDFEKCWTVIRQYMGQIKPASTFFEARLFNDDMKVEMEITAKCSNKR